MIASKQDLLPLPAELRLMVYSHVPISALLELDLCSKSLHEEIQPLISRRATLNIARRKGEAREEQYSHDLQTLERLHANPSTAPQNVIVYPPHGLRQKKTFRRVFSAFVKAIKRVQEVGVPNITIAIFMPRWGFKEKDNFIDTINSTMDLFSPHGDPNGLKDCKLIINGVKSTTECWYELRLHLAAWGREEEGANLKEIEIWTPWNHNGTAFAWFPSYWNEQENRYESCAGGLNDDCKVRVAHCERQQEIFKQSPSITYYPTSLVNELLDPMDASFKPITRRTEDTGTVEQGSSEDSTRQDGQQSSPRASSYEMSLVVVTL